MPNDNEPAATSYDAIPYSVHAFPQTRPDRLATLARLFGLNAARPQRCRVLELGCASGGNLIPMALAEPESRFVGIDLSSRQIADGKAVVRELNVANLELKHLSIMDVGVELGGFDYILVHGVYSWVPPEVQRKILAICKANLAPHGVAYVSYNCLPGWHARGAIREMLWYHVARFTDPAQRVREARGLLAFLAKSAAGQDGFYSGLMRQELAVLHRTPDSYLLHEHLEEYNEPLYFHEFIERAAAHRLQYLGEAQIGAMMASQLGAETEQTLRKISADLLHMEQYMDFVRNRMFRQTLLCHADVKLEHALRAEAVQDFYIASAAKAVSAQPDVDSDTEEQFGAAGRSALTTRDPLMKATMVDLSRRWPLPVSFDQLLAAARARLKEPGAAGADQARQLAVRLLNCHASGIVEFTAAPSRFVIEVSDRPVASPYARLRAREGPKVNNMRLEALMLSEPALLLLRHLDGQHDQAALVELLAEWIEKAAFGAVLPASAGDDAVTTDPAVAGLPPRERARRAVPQMLEAFARSALLLG